MGLKRDVLTSALNSHSTLLLIPVGDAKHHFGEVSLQLNIFLQHVSVSCLLQTFFFVCTCFRTNSPKTRDLNHFFDLLWFEPMSSATPTHQRVRFLSCCQLHQGMRCRKMPQVAIPRWLAELCRIDGVFLNLLLTFHVVNFDGAAKMTTYDHTIWIEPDPQVFIVHAGSSEFTLTAFVYGLCDGLMFAVQNLPARLAHKKRMLKTPKWSNSWMVISKGSMPEKSTGSRMGWMGTFARKKQFQRKTTIVSDQCSPNNTPLSGLLVVK